MGKNGVSKAFKTFKEKGESAFKQLFCGLFQFSKGFKRIVQNVIVNENLEEQLMATVMATPKMNINFGGKYNHIRYIATNTRQ